MTEEEAYRLKHAAIYAAREREAAAETAKHVKAFEAAARKLDRAILQIAAGEEGVKFPIEALHTRRNKPEIRGDEAARDACDARIDGLRARWIEAKEIGRLARIDARHAESKRIGDEMHDREIARGGWEKELTLLGMLRRGGR